MVWREGTMASLGAESLEEVIQQMEMSIFVGSALFSNLD